MCGLLTPATARFFHAAERVMTCFVCGCGYGRARVRASAAVVCVDLALRGLRWVVTCTLHTTPVVVWFRKCNHAAPSTRLRYCSLVCRDAVTPCSRIGFLRPTLYSPGMWATEVRPVYNDTAYTTIALPPHTDGCYWDDQPGLQVTLT